MLHQWATMAKGTPASVPVEVIDKVKAVVRELQQANDILRATSAYFAQTNSTARSSNDRVH